MARGTVLCGRNRTTPRQHCAISGKQSIHCINPPQSACRPVKHTTNPLVFTQKRFGIIVVLLDGRNGKPIRLAETINHARLNRCNPTFRAQKPRKCFTIGFHRRYTLVMQSTHCGQRSRLSSCPSQTKSMRQSVGPRQFEFDWCIQLQHSSP